MSLALIGIILFPLLSVIFALFVSAPFIEAETKKSVVIAFAKGFAEKSSFKDEIVKALTS